MTDQNHQEQPNFQDQPMYQGAPNFSQQGTYGSLPGQDMPENNMTMSIVATVLGFICCTSCCIAGIIGIISIVFSSQVSSKYNIGDVQGAADSAKTAKTLAIVSLVITGVTFLGTMIYYAILIASGSMEALFQQQMELLEQLQ